MVLQLLLGGKVSFLLDVRMLEEYSEVLQRPKFGFRKEWINPLLDFLRSEGEFVVPQPVSGVFPDPDDAVFFEVAKAGGADYLVTGNTRHFPDDKIVVTPKEFLDDYGDRKLR